MVEANLRKFDSSWKGRMTSGIPKRVKLFDVPLQTSHEQDPWQMAICWTFGFLVALGSKGFGVGFCWLRIEDLAPLS